MIFINMNRHALNANRAANAEIHPTWRVKFEDDSVKYAWDLDILGHVPTKRSRLHPLDGMASHWQEVAGEVLLLDADGRPFAGVGQEPGNELLY